MTFLKLEIAYNTYRYVSKAHSRMSLNLKIIRKSYYVIDLTTTHGRDLIRHDHASPKTHTFTLNPHNIIIHKLTHA